VRRSAQDDDFAGVLTKNIQSKLALMGRSGDFAEIQEWRPLSGYAQANS